MKRSRRAALVMASIAVPAAVAASETISYTYDELGRLKGSATSGGPNAGTTVATSYDKAGNRTGYSLTETEAAALAASPVPDGLELSAPATDDGAAEAEPSFGPQPPAGIPDEPEPVVAVDPPGGENPSSGSAGGQ